MRVKGKVIFRGDDGREKIVSYSGSKEFIEEVLTIVDLHSKKNMDYSKVTDPYSNFFAIEGIVPAYVGVFVRMSDKWERMKNLLAKGEENRAVKEESLIDTARDLAVYSLIFVSLLRRRREEKGKEMFDPLEDLEMESYMTG